MELDTAELKREVKIRRIIDDGANMKKTAQRVGVSPATICRIENEKPIDLVNFIKILNWLQVGPERFIK